MLGLKLIHVSKRGPSSYQELKEEFTQASQKVPRGYTRSSRFDSWNDFIQSIKLIPNHGLLTRYVKLWVAHAPGIPGTFSRHRPRRKTLISDSDIYHGTCVTHVPWWMSESLTRGGGEIVPGIPGAYATRNFTYLVRGPLKARTNLIKTCTTFQS